MNSIKASGGGLTCCRLCWWVKLETVCQHMPEAPVHPEDDPSKMFWD